MAGEQCLPSIIKLLEITYLLSLTTDGRCCFHKGKLKTVCQIRQMALVFANYKQDTRKKRFKERAKVHIPNEVPMAVCQEWPVVLDKKRAAVGHLDITHIFSVIQDAAKVQGCGLDKEIWEVDFSPNSDLLLMRMLKKLYLQSLLYYPAAQVFPISRVESEAEMKFLPCPQLHWLQVDRVLITSMMKSQGLIAWER